MTTSKTHDYLIRLRDLIIQEREFAKALDLPAMAKIMHEKEELMQILAHVQTIEQEDKSIATQIRHENRRNAYLFRATLGWIRGTMEFFGKQSKASTYSASAGTIFAPVNGRLLSGRI